MLEIATDEEVKNILTGRHLNNAKLEQIKNANNSELPLVKITKLPSGFKGYPEGTVISYAPLTLGELETLNNSDEVDVERGLAMLLNSIHFTTISTSDLYYWDVMYISIRRKLLAFGNTHGILYAQCPNYRNIEERDFGFRELEFKGIETPALPIITKLQDKEVEIGLLTIKDFKEVDINKGELDINARMIINLPYEEAYTLASSCYEKDSKKIRNIDKILNCGMKPLYQLYNPELKISKQNPNKIICQKK